MKRAVLLVDDDRLLLRAMQRQLVLIERDMAEVGKGFEVMVATSLSNAKALLQTVDGQTSVCVLCDGGLSDGNGIAFVVHCRLTLGVRLADGRVCSGDISGRIEAMAREAGVPSHAKPFLLFQEYSSILRAAFQA